MEQACEKCNEFRREVSYHGLIRRVALRMGKSESLVSMVNRGKVKSQKVLEALQEEKAAMRREQDLAER
jgi:hypothetical protein